MNPNFFSLPPSFFLLPRDIYKVFVYWQFISDTRKSQKGKEQYIYILLHFYKKGRSHLFDQRILLQENIHTKTLTSREIQVMWRDFVNQTECATNEWYTDTHGDVFNAGDTLKLIFKIWLKEKRKKLICYGCLMIENKEFFCFIFMLFTCGLKFI